MATTTTTRSTAPQQVVAPEPAAVEPQAPPTSEPVVAADNDEPTINYRSIYVSSILAVSLVFLVGVGVPTAFALDSWSAGLAIGAFTAFWGGPSFGVMTGSARVSAWHERHGIDH